MQSGFRIRAIVDCRCRVSLLALGLAGAFIGTGVAQAPSGNKAASSDGRNLEGVLAGMDRAAAGFTSVSANLEYTKVTVIVDDHSTERGNIYFEKSKGKLRVMLAFQQPSEKYVLFSDGKVSIYRPKIAEIEEYSLANNQGLLEQFLLLGFGTSGSDLQETYQVSLKGEETLGGEAAVHLELIPKNPEVSARLQRIELWLSPKTWQPLQQIFYEPSKDYLIARYSNSRQNAKIPGKNFELPVRGKVRTVRPQSGN
ncbi:MAG: outer membrane lipoprotein carrier protein LolA [Acidobacteria bacterium]|nr:outer membrane lipoprotein carrier protein LolA [Acidobacteriota bacterium]